MTRKQNSFTKRQLRFLESIQDKIREINDPDKPYISHESCYFQVKQTKQFGNIPKIVFTPHGTQIKAEIIRNAGLTNESREKEIDKIRVEMGFTNPRDKAYRIFARLFESEWNNIMFKAKKATFTMASINNLFVSGNQQVADPVLLLQGIVMDEYNREMKSGKEIVREVEKLSELSSKKSYEDELMEIQN
jgi:hypothetical protein